MNAIPGEVKPWTDAEVDFIMRNRRGMSARVIGERLGRTKSSVEGKWRGLDAMRNPPPESSMSPWTDDDLSFVQDHPDWTTRRIGEELGRSPGAITGARRAIKNGWQREREPWTEEEDTFLLATPNFTAAQAASYLAGRTERAVNHRRWLLREVKGVRFDEYVKDPFRPGARPLVAKTCTKCGLLLSASWFHFIAKKRYWRECCIRCAEKSRRPGRGHTVKQIAQTRAAFMAKQAITRENASRHGYAWLAEDHSVLSDPDLTLTEKALALGRTYSAVIGACSTNGYTSKVGLGDPERDLWRIDNPNAMSA